MTYIGMSIRRVTRHNEETGYEGKSKMAFVKKGFNDRI